MAVIEPQQDVETQIVTVTEAAANTIENLLTEREIPNHVLRVFVSGGGCSGMQYGMAFEEKPRESDIVVNVPNGTRIVVDPTSVMYIEGATIDFVDSLMGGGFRIDNPQAASTCGCGHSFRTEEEQSAADDDAPTAGCGTCSSY